MANKPLKSIKYPGLSDTYTFVQIGTEAGQAADAKVVGDEIERIKSDLNAFGYEELNVTFDSSFYVNQNGGKSTVSGFGNSGRIPVKAGETIRAYVKGVSNNMCLLAYSDNPNANSFAGLIVATSDNPAWIEYTFDFSTYAILSSNINSHTPIIFKFRNTNDIYSELTSSILNVEGLEKQNLVWDTSFFITATGTKGTASGWGNSGAIPVYKGDTVRAYVRGIESNVSLMSFSKSSSPTTFTPLLVAFDNNYHWIEKTFDEECFVFLCSATGANKQEVYKYSPKRHVYVSTSGNDITGDGSYNNPYASIYKANDSILDNSERNQYVIHVADGTYTDLQTKYSGVGETSDYQGVVCKDYVEYIGDITNPSNCVITWDGATGLTNPSYADVRMKCPFHIRGAGFVNGTHTAIKGFKIVGKNLRYCMHIDTGGKGDNVVWEISDCIFDWKGNPDISEQNWFAVACIGTGSSNFEKGKLIRCEIINASGISLGYQNHDTVRYSGYNDDPAFVEGAKIHIESCNFNNTDIQFRSIYANVITQGFDRVYLHNCIGVNKFEPKPGTDVVQRWRAEIKCSEISNNLFSDYLM